MRSSDLKYLGFGFGIGSTLAILVLGGWFLLTPQFNVIGSGLPLADPDPVTVPASTLTLTSIPPSTATAAFPPVPSLTFTPSPSPAPTATLTTTELMVASGEIVIMGPWGREQQLRLYEESLSFIAPTYEESKRMSVMINQARFSDPSNTCGPLSIAILQKAGFLGEELVAHDFFLINPDLGKDRAIIKSFFPPEKYSDTRRKVRIDREDWYANPLLPGDFLYLYAGTGGNFEHMLVVNRVDSAGRAYSVTNYNTEEGFIIKEALLYDPADPNAGLFQQWTEKQFAKLGSTGFAGYEVWRLKENQ
jgi:hypothetical protein